MNFLTTLETAKFMLWKSNVLRILSLKIAVIPVSIIYPWQEIVKIAWLHNFFNKKLDAVRVPLKT